MRARATIAFVVAATTLSMATAGASAAGGACVTAADRAHAGRGTSAPRAPSCS